ncbi:MAG: DUF2066 domain-containing protein [Saccharospirillum sp.]|uniref:DUF2066 domain-containing protein n=1 Tax=Saccharospirillum sp. TaxID=2033801 RepID=UPI0034A056DB
MLFRTVSLACLLLLSLPVWAARTVDVYADSAILAQNASDQDQNEAVREALLRVLIRATGEADIVSQERTEPLLRNASDYLSTFRFQTSDALLTNVLGESVPTKRMVMQFDQQSIEQWLVNQRLPVWGTRRPEVLLWLADRLQGRDRILTDGDNHTLAVELNNRLDNRGLPVVLPIMDLTDTLNVSFTDVYGLFTGDIEAASERYPSDAIAVGRLAQQGNGYQADVVFLMRDTRERLQVVGATEAELMQRLADELSDRIADQYAVLRDPAMVGQLALRVNNVIELSTLAAVERYLESLNVVTQVTLRQVAADSVQFDLEISGDRNQLRDVLALDRRIVPVEELTLETQLDNELVYRWQ